MINRPPSQPANTPPREKPLTPAQAREQLGFGMLQAARKTQR